jgi:hypothetical protein
VLSYLAARWFCSRSDCARGPGLRLWVASPGVGTHSGAALTRVTYRRPVENCDSDIELFATGVLLLTVVGYATAGLERAVQERPGRTAQGYRRFRRRLCAAPPLWSDNTWKSQLSRLHCSRGA